METKELIFNGKKFFEGQVPCYFGKKVKAPTKRINGYVFDGNAAQRIGSDDSFMPEDGTTITGQAKNIGSNEVFLHTNLSWEYWFTLTDLLQNGGVSASYMTHALLRRKELVA